MQNNHIDITEFESTFTKLWRFLKWMPGAFYTEFSESGFDDQFLMFIVFALACAVVSMLSILVWLTSGWLLLPVAIAIGLFDLLRFVGYVQVRMSSYGK